MSAKPNIKKSDFSTAYYVPGYARGLAFLGIPLMLAGAVLTKDGPWGVLYGLFFCAFTTLLVLFVITSFKPLVVIEASRIKIARTLAQPQVVLKKDIDKVSWEKGCGVYLKLKDGTHVKMSVIGHNIQGVANTLRTWLKKSVKI